MGESGMYDGMVDGCVCMRRGSLANPCDTFMILLAPRMDRTTIARHKITNLLAPSQTNTKTNMTNYIWIWRERERENVCKNEEDDEGNTKKSILFFIEKIVFCRLYVAAKQNESIENFIRVLSLHTNKSHVLHWCWCVGPATNAQRNMFVSFSEKK